MWLSLLMLPLLVSFLANSKTNNEASKAGQSRIQAGTDTQPESNVLNRVPANNVTPLVALPEIDVRKLALQRRIAVEKILGRPDADSDPSPDVEGYSWGFVVYEHGFLSQIDYEFKQRPSNTREALEKVGLRENTKPRHGPLSYYWNSSTGPLICCGFEFDNIVISDDLSGISVGVRKRVTDHSRAEQESQIEARNEYGNAALVEATVNGDMPTVRQLLVKGANVNGRGSGGFTPLMFAASQRHVELVKLLLTKGADVNAQTGNGHTALMCTGDARIVETLLAAGADVNAQRRDGMTPLIIAVTIGNAPTVGLLLAKSADVNARMADDQGMFGGWTALDYAEWKGDTAVTRLLTNHRGISANQR